MEGQSFENKNKEMLTLGGKIKMAAEKVVGYFRERFDGVLDRIIENPYFETERDF